MGLRTTAGSRLQGLVTMLHRGSSSHTCDDRTASWERIGQCHYYLQPKFSSLHSRPVIVLSYMLMPAWELCS